MNKVSVFISFVLFAGLSAYAAPYQGNPRSVQNGRMPTNVKITSAVRAADVADSASQQAAVENTAASADDGTAAAVDEILGRYRTARQNASDYCTLVSGGIDKLKIFAGISTGSSVGGILAGGAAAATGFMKEQNDKVIADIVDKNSPLGLSAYVDTLKKVDELSKRDQAEKTAAIDNGDVLRIAADLTRQLPQSELDAAKDKSELYGTIRTAGSFTAGGAGALSAAMSFISFNDFDDVIKNINSCNPAIQQIDKIKTELQFADSSNSTLAEMNKIVDSCSGMNSDVIAKIKGKLATTGVISSVGGVLGITGGITSLAAAGGEKNGKSAATDNKDGGTKQLNTASNWLAAGTATASLASMVFGALAVDGLMKNGDIAYRCKLAFESN
jgi:hypothetical protein